MGQQTNKVFKRKRRQRQIKNRKKRINEMKKAGKTGS
jgi:hypothetical protein